MSNHHHSYSLKPTVSLSPIPISHHRSNYEGRETPFLFLLLRSLIPMQQWLTMRLPRRGRRISVGAIGFEDHSAGVVVVFPVDYAEVFWKAFEERRERGVVLVFVGIGFVQFFISRSPNYDNVWDTEEEQQQQKEVVDRIIPSVVAAVVVVDSPKQPKAVPTEATPPISLSDEEMIKSVVSVAIPSYSLESKLGNCYRAAMIRTEALQRITRKSLDGLPLGGFDYESILGQCCEMLSSI